MDDIAVKIITDMHNAANVGEHDLHYGSRCTG